MTVADHCAELATLAPMLGPALTRDNTHTGRGRPIAPLNLYNTDVLLAKIVLAAEIPAAAIRATELIGEPWPQDGRTWDACRIGLPRWHDRLHAKGLATGRRTRQDGSVIACCHLDDLAARWVRITKQALGLRSHPRELNAACPHCETGILILDSGAEGYVKQTGPDRYTLSWTHGAHVWCPACEADWPQSHWDLLIRLIGQAEHARNLDAVAQYAPRVS